MSPCNCATNGHARRCPVHTQADFEAQQEKKSTTKEVAIASFEMGQEKGRADARRELLLDLQKRMQTAADTLGIQGSLATDPHEQIRLRGKTDGMKVALSYVEEYLRG